MAAKSKAAGKKMRKPTSKSELFTHIATKTDLKKRQVGAVFDELSKVIQRDIKQSGVFNLIGLMKIKVIRKPATKARKGINPFTKEAVVFKAKPARNAVKVQPLKSLKSMV
ncbi:MAG: HU family DNA-binding protein [Acidiferrobacteraceae bacterium]